MFSIFKKSQDTNTIPDAIYGTVMARSRNPVFFSKFGIEDVVMGRFDVLSLHVYLIARRLKKDGSEIAMALSQDIFDLYVYDVERALRELGIGDTSVPKKKKKMIRSFYGIIEDFDEPIDRGDRHTLEERAANRFFGDSNVTDNVRELVAYIMDMENALHEFEFTDFTQGAFSWPETREIKN